jgi:chromosome partitioning protein
MYDPRSSLTNAVSAQLRKYFDDKLYRVSIPRNVRLAEAPSHGKPALAYDRHSKGATAYLALAAEILKKDRKTEVSRKIMESEKYGH